MQKQSDISFEFIHHRIEGAHTEDTLVNMFRRNFTGAPRREVWSDDSARQFIRSYYTETSIFILAHQDEKCVGAIFGCHVKDSLIPGELLKHTEGLEGFYIATVMVDKPFREKNIATQLVNLIENEVRDDYDVFIARTRLDIINAMILFLKNGYQASEPVSSSMGSETSLRVYHVKRKDVSPFESVLDN